MSHTRWHSVAALTVACAALFMFSVTIRGGNDEPAKAKVDPPTAVEFALDKSVSFDFVDMPLKDVVAAVTKVSGIEVQLDLKRLEEASVNDDTKVTFSCHDLPLRVALHWMLEPLDLSYVTDDEVLMITTEGSAKERVETRVYDVHDLIISADGQQADFGPLIDAIVSTISPTSWDVGGGAPPIFSVGFSLVIPQTAEVHDHIRALLDALRQAKLHLSVSDLRDGIIVEPPAIRDLESKILKALDSRPDLQFSHTPLKDVVERLRSFGIPVYLNPRAVGDGSISPATKVTYSAKELRLATALEGMLRTVDLGYVIRDSVLMITTAEDAKSSDLCIVYPIGDFFPPDGAPADVSGELDNLRNAIRNTMMPQSWSDSGGSGSLSMLPDAKALIVCQTVAGQRGCAHLLAQLRAARSDVKPPVYDPAELMLRVYSLNRKAMPDSADKELLAVIRGAVEPKSWSVEGAYLGKVADTLVVRQTRSVQAKIDEFLKQIVASAPSGGGGVSGGPF